jgi:molecular chaperone GrpE (heat shock protein)
MSDFSLGRRESKIEAYLTDEERMDVAHLFMQQTLSDLNLVSYLCEDKKKKETFKNKTVFFNSAHRNVRLAIAYLHFNKENLKQRQENKKIDYEHYAGFSTEDMFEDLLDTIDSCEKALCNLERSLREGHPREISVDMICGAYDARDLVDLAYKLNAFLSYRSEH